MTEVQGTPYDWLKALEPELIELQDLSTTGGPEGFAWDQLSALLAQRFEINDFSISPADAQWRDAKEIQKGLGRRVWSLAFSVASLPGQAAWLMTESDIAILMASLLTKESSNPAKVDHDFQHGFFQFLGIEITNILSQLGFTGDHSVTFLPDQKAPDGAGMCLDTELGFCGQSLKSRLVIDQEMTRAWKETFHQQGGQRRINPKVAGGIEVMLHLEAGNVAIKPSELANAQPGDFLLLDNCTVLPGEEKGRVIMTVRGIPLFRGMLKQDKIKVLEYPLYHKVEASMDEEQAIETEGEEEMDTGLGEGLSLQERANDIPFTLNVEVGRIKMRLEKLMELQPGQLLELEVHPEEGVDLVVNGRSIGRGELLRLGEALGVRILEIS